MSALGNFGRGSAEILRSERNRAFNFGRAFGWGALAGIVVGAGAYFYNSEVYLTGTPTPDAMIAQAKKIAADAQKTITDSRAAMYGQPVEPGWGNYSPVVPQSELPTKVHKHRIGQNISFEQQLLLQHTNGTAAARPVKVGYAQELPFRTFKQHVVAPKFDPA